jgi:hypothetical protein
MSEHGKKLHLGTDEYGRLLTRVRARERGRAATIRRLLALQELDRLLAGDPGTVLDMLFDQKQWNDRLICALQQSLRHQNFYAQLLNMGDGGQRRLFGTPAEWLAALEECKGQAKEKHWLVAHEFRSTVKPLERMRP